MTGRVTTQRRVAPKWWKGKRLVQTAIHVAALAPLAVLLWDIWQNNLSVNPIQDITHRTGKTALVLLVLSLACTPASSLLGIRQAIAWRRPLGLYAFLYVSLHFLTFVGLDYGFDARLLKEAIFEKRYALVGFAAFVLLIPLAITSTDGWKIRLRHRWRKLHRLVYVAALLAVVHYVWLVKADVRVPLQYGAIVVLLLLLRLSPVKSFFRRKVAPRRSPPAPTPTPKEPVYEE